LERVPTKREQKEHGKNIKRRPSSGTKKKIGKGVKRKLIKRNH